MLRTDEGGTQRYGGRLRPLFLSKDRRIVLWASPEKRLRLSKA